MIRFSTMRQLLPAGSNELRSLPGKAKTPAPLDDKQSDESLLTRIAAGDLQALAELFHRYARFVRGIVYKVVQDESEADDLLQDVFLHINRKSGMFDSSKGMARSWIAQVAYRHAIERRRRLKSRHYYTHVSLDESVLDALNTEDTADHYEQSLEGMCGKRAIKEVFEALSENQRRTLGLFFFAGYTFEEIALDMQQSVGNVKNHYYRGLDKLRRKLGSGPGS